MARLIYVMDPMCSWCWGFSPVAARLAEQAAASGVSSEWRVGGLRRGGAALDPAKRAYILEHWQAVAQTSGQPFRREEAMPSGFVYDTEPACRALVAVRQLAPELVPAAAHNIQQAFYAQGQDVTRANVLAACVEAAGVPAIEFVDVFDSTTCRAATEADFAWVERLGISGFPTVLLEHNDQLALLTNGYRAFDELSPLLARWLQQLAT
ncbi:DsbA family protein [Atopomonas sediminilitoris]|uniref:DsbA family protein n=1 Tax=Atopomonas sediminilitoris TaxID=2919919 RepID=UPI001F4E9343|nr:DsbA family protein [Atopomonas sediminilitoris]MCJ8168824.1 DsbA family protein [Atopomonas sediminilitoris]